MHSTPLISAPANGDCIVWTEDTPVACCPKYSCEEKTLNLDGKIPMLGYDYSLLSSVEEDLPPKYNFRDTGRQSFTLRLLRYTFVDHFVLKVVAAYLFLVCFTGETYLSLPFESSHRRSSEVMRSHSRDFMGQLEVHGLYDDEAGWSTSRLGRVGYHSPLLTFSELGLLGEVEWEAEPDDELEFNDQFMLAAAEKPAFLPLKAYSKLPLPLRMPSNIFEYSRHFFHKHAKHHHHQSSSLGHNRVSLQSSKIHNQGPLFSIKKLVLQRHDLA